MLDLHAHSTASDGTLSPTQLVSLAEKVGLTAVALTDHDTVEGLPEAIRAAANTRVELVPGVELSTQLDRGTLHIVGLFVDHQNDTLRSGLHQVMKMRNDRNPRLAARLAEIGLPVTMEEAEKISGTDVVGRPHFAAVMIDKGYVKDLGEAFAKYLGRDGSAHVEKARLAPGRAIEFIRAAGGVPVLAHPDQTNRKGDELDALVGELASTGLGGIECFCSPYHSQMTTDYTRLARKYNLVRSGGSDFHGQPKPKIKLGRGFGSLYVRDDLLGKIRERAEEIRATT